MQVDKVTIKDLSIFHKEEEHSVFNYLNFTQTVGGKEWLRAFVDAPFDNLRQIEDTQKTLQLIIKEHSKWPVTIITNGTIMVIERFYETAIQEIPSHANFISAFFYRVFNLEDFALVRYSVKHFIDLAIGMNQIAEFLSKENPPVVLQVLTERVKLLLNKPFIQNYLKGKTESDLSTAEMLTFGHYMKRHYKHEALELVEIYSKLDAYYSLATACITHQLTFPTLTDSVQPFVEVEDLYHPLLNIPVSYNITLDKEKNFLFLTGANMAGKSTFIKAVGVSVYLAHLGIGVPAKKMHLSLFDGLLSNIQVEDNIIKGESYFFNEVQRIKKTIEKISDGKKWLILIDELFKGTNVQDAMKCSTAVIEGLRKMPNAAFILSTHLYEIGADLQHHSNILFRYFETDIQDDQLVFSYQLKEGISNDRLGYLILKREGVVTMLDKL